MRFLEKDLENIIYETNNEILREKGLNIYGKKFRQVRLSHYGVADLVTVERYGQSLHICLIELKKDTISVDTLIQSLRYIKGIKHYLRKRGFHKNVSFTIKLCGSSISNLRELSLICSHVSSGVELVDLYTYDFKIDGIIFKDQYQDFLDNIETEAFFGVSSKKKKEEFYLF